MDRSTYLGTYDHCLDASTKFHVYSIFSTATYEMGLCVLDDHKETVMVTLFHFEDGEKKRLRHSANNEEQVSFLKVYTTKSGRYFSYDRKRIYLPK